MTTKKTAGMTERMGRAAGEGFLEGVSKRLQPILDEQIGPFWAKLHKEFPETARETIRGAASEAKAVGKKAIRGVSVPAGLGAATGAITAPEGERREGALRGAAGGLVGGLVGSAWAPSTSPNLAKALVTGGSIFGGGTAGRLYPTNQAKHAMTERQEKPMKNKYAGVTLDWYDDKGATLKSKFPTPESLPEVIKQADVRPLEKLANEDFALIALDEGHVLRKFACHDPGTTAMSVIYFMEHGDKLPEEAIKMAATNLADACEQFEIEPPVAMLKAAGLQRLKRIAESGLRKLRATGTMPKGLEEAGVTGQKKILRRANKYGGADKYLPRIGLNPNEPPPGASSMSEALLYAKPTGPIKTSAAGQELVQVLRQAGREAGPQAGKAGPGFASKLKDLFNRARGAAGAAGRKAWDVGGQVVANPHVQHGLIGGGIGGGISGGIAGADSEEGDRLRSIARGIAYGGLMGSAAGLGYGFSAGRPGAALAGGLVGLPAGVAASAHNEDSRSSVKRAAVDITGKRPAPKIKVAHSDNPEDYAVVMPDGRRYYPIHTWDLVKKAEVYFHEERGRMQPEIRRQYAVKLAAKAEMMGYPLDPEIVDAGAINWASKGHLKAAVEMRKVACAPGADRQFLDELFQKRASIDPATYAEVLRRFDVSHGFDYGWDRVILDPWASTYGMKKTADVVWEDGNDRVTNDQLVSLAQNHLPRLRQILTEGMCKEFVKDPIGIFESMPLPQKKIISRLASDHPEYSEVTQAAV